MVVLLFSIVNQVILLSGFIKQASTLQNVTSIQTVVNFKLPDLSQPPPLPGWRIQRLRWQ